MQTVEEQYRCEVEAARYLYIAALCRLGGVVCPNTTREAMNLVDRHPEDLFILTQAIDMIERATDIRYD